MPKSRALMSRARHGSICGWFYSGRTLPAPPSRAGHGANFAPVLPRVAENLGRDVPIEKTPFTLRVENY